MARGRSKKTSVTNIRKKARAIGRALKSLNSSLKGKTTKRRKRKTTRRRRRRRS